jgi:hypothetical protein
MAWNQIGEKVWIDTSGRNVRFCVLGHITEEEARQVQDNCHYSAFGYGFYEFSHTASNKSGKPATTWCCSANCD